VSTDLLAIARAIMSPQPDASVDASLASEGTLKIISPTAMAVLKDTLAKGAVRMLARLGGARAIVRGGTTGGKPSRAYDVREPPVLAFGPYTFELLRWLTNTPLGVSSAKPFNAQPATEGDEIVAYLTHRLVAGRRFERTVALWVTSPLAMLGFARSIARVTAPAPLAVSSFLPLLATAEGRLIVECLAGDLAERWNASTAWRTGDLLEFDLAVRILTHERATLDAFLDAVVDAKRWDLATFVVDAAFAALPAGQRPDTVVARVMPAVRPGGTLRARTEARQRAGALLHVLPRLARTFESSALVRFIDDDYDGAQSLLSSWSAFGREGFARAAAVTTELGSLAGFGASDA